MFGAIHAAGAYLACLCAGVVAMPLNLRLTAAELTELVARTC